MRFLTIAFFFALVAVSSARLPKLGLPLTQKLPIQLPGNLEGKVPVVGQVAEDVQVVAVEEGAPAETNDAEEPAQEEEQPAPEESNDNNVAVDEKADDGAKKKLSRRHGSIRMPRLGGIPHLRKNKLSGRWSRRSRN